MVNKINNYLKILEKSYLKILEEKYKPYGGKRIASYKLKGNNKKKP
jgi:hypothetical protein